ncbi:MAG TPA: hemerythrin domain-containing protein [Burkholderiales bacterium]|nr:hemerythrin domain-containing protein [Burkholderiales bacterium]
MAKSRRKIDAIKLLKQDHKEVDGLFKEFEKLDEAGEDAVEQVIATACTELEIHDKIETEIFYPAVRQQAEQEEVEDLLDEAEVEHTTVRDLIKKIKGMGAGDKKRNAHFTVLMEYVKHHVKEEEKEMFPKVKQLGLDFGQLGRQMQDRKDELMAEMGIDVDALEEERQGETA